MEKDFEPNFGQSWTGLNWNIVPVKGRSIRTSAENQLGILLSWIVYKRKVDNLLGSLAAAGMA